MWQWSRRIWSLVRRRRGLAPDAPIPAELLAGLQRLVEDELAIRERKRRADRFQRAGATAIATLVASIVILGLIAADVAPKQSTTVSDSLTSVPLLTLLITVAVAGWNVLGWWGARQAVRFTSLYWWLIAAALFCLLDAGIGISVLYTWAIGEPVPPTWARGSGLGAMASNLLPILIVLGIAIGTDFLYDDFDSVTSAKGASFLGQFWWGAFSGCAVLGLVISSMAATGTLTSQLVLSSELKTVAFIVAYVSAGLSLLASVPVVIITGSSLI